MLLDNFNGAFRKFGGRRVAGLRHSFTNHSLKFIETMSSSVYERAVSALNGLQSNSAVLQNAREERSAKADLNISDTMRHLKTLQINMDDINSLNVIHIAGTKGKGSTCAFTESILRNHGYKTGFYSSPHLISVNERIRIDGVPLPKDKFAAYFWEVYASIQRSLKDDENMPPYFLFLTVMAFYVFIKEQVEAAIIEVGIGGLYDCTNIVRQPIAVGITTLGIDHVSILGNSLSEIAMQKAGILKPEVPAFTVPQQESAMKVLIEKAHSVGCSLRLSPQLEAYEQKVSLGIQGLVQNVNASLALQLSNTWLTSCHKGTKVSETSNKSFENDVSNKNSLTSVTVADTFHISSEMQKGLENCIWPGRFQVVKRKGVTFYLDGAHTQQSMKFCGKWFKDISKKHTTNDKLNELKVLFFNCTGERKAESLLDPLADIKFDIALFSPNKIDVIKDASSDLSNFMVDPEKEMQQCLINKEIWCHFMRSLYENQFSMACNNSNSLNQSFNETRLEYNNAIIFPSISNALSWINSGKFVANVDNNANIKELSELVNQASHIHVLVTGSLHLVGGVLSLIQS